MKKPTNIKRAYHRNGIGGEGFEVCLFEWEDDDDYKKRNMMAILFNEQGQCAVLDVDELKKGNIEFAAGNSWRGDNFEEFLRNNLNY